MPGLAARVTLGAPGVYHEPPAPFQALTGVRMDVCAFVGVAPRGPSRVPVVGPFGDKVWADDVPCVEAERPRLRSVAVQVDSWDQYRRLYGSFEGAGLLPFAVASFFEQGGRRAYVVRIVHDYGPGHAGDRTGVATAGFKGLTGEGGTPVNLWARNEGVWGNSLQAQLSFVTTPLTPQSMTGAELVLFRDDPLNVGSLLRISYADMTRELRMVMSVDVTPPASGIGLVKVAMLDGTLGPNPIRAELVEGTLDLEDGDRRYPRRERHEHLGLGFGHPRWVASVLCYESELVFPDEAWSNGQLNPLDTTLPSAQTVDWTGGADLSAQIEPEDFFDSQWVPGDEDPAAGVHALLEVDEVAMVVAPDLYSPEPVRPVEDVADPATLAGKAFERCVPVSVPPPAPPEVPDLKGLRLNPQIPAELARITDLQLKLVEVAEQASLVALLDVPPRLHPRQILAWRARFDSSFAACYHPWLKVVQTEDLQLAPSARRLQVPPPVPPEALVDVNPSAVAAGVIANREWLYGVPFGPANELTQWVIDVVEAVSPAGHDKLHQAAINVYLKERDGVRLTAARTMSHDPAYRQLSVRRLMTMLIRVLEREMQFLVFEPNNGALRSYVEVMLDSFLRRLYAAGAFKGANETEAFFVRADDSLNPPWVSDQGRLIVEIGVAPAEPLEFLVLRINREGDGTLRVEGRSA
jgi:uncharacterized protein